MVGFGFVFIFLVVIMVFVWSCTSSCPSSPRDHCKPLPNEILVDILKRLSAEHLLRFQLVCKRWNSLISIPNFYHMHLNYGGTVPTIAVQLQKKEKSEIIFLADRVEKGLHGLLRKIKKSIRSFVSSKNMKIEVTNSNKQFNLAFKFSYHGLILFQQNRGTYTLFNPITKEQFTLQYNGEISAFFFHPFANKYYALIWKISDRRKSYVAEFKLLTLRSLLSNNLDSGKKLSIWLPYVVPWTTPIITRDAIYWIAGEYHHEPGVIPTDGLWRVVGSHFCTYASCETAVIIFDIKEEEFHLISHPRDIICYNRGEHSHMHLFEKESFVSFCEFSLIGDDEVTMHVWDLLGEYSWSPRETIILHMKPFPFRHLDCDSGWNSNVIAIGTLNGELILSWKRRGVFAYNLQLRRLRKLEDGRADNVFIHTKTFLSL